MPMAAVFMATSSTLALYIGFAPRWLAVLGYTCAAFILFGSGYVDWVLFGRYSSAARLNAESTLRHP